MSDSNQNSKNQNVDPELTHNLPGREVGELDEHDNNYDMSILTEGDNEDVHKGVNFEPIDKDKLLAGLSTGSSLTDENNTKEVYNKETEVSIEDFQQNNMTDPGIHIAKKDLERKESPPAKESEPEEIITEEKPKVALNISRPQPKNKDNAKPAMEEIPSEGDVSTNPITTSIVLDDDISLLDSTSNNLEENDEDNNEAENQEMPLAPIIMDDTLDNIELLNEETMDDLSNAIESEVKINAPIVVEDNPSAEGAITLEDVDLDNLTLDVGDVIPDEDEEAIDLNTPLSEDPFLEEAEDNPYANLTNSDLRRMIRDAVPNISFSILSSGMEVLRHGYANIEELPKYLEVASSKNIDLETALLDEGIIKDDDMLRLKAAKNKIDYVDLEKVKVDDIAVQYLSREDATKYQALPYATTIDESDDIIVYVAIDPANIVVAKAEIPLLIRANGGETKLVAASNFLIKEAVVRHYSKGLGDEEFEEIKDEFGDDFDESMLLEDDSETREAGSIQATEEPAVKAVNQILSSALVTGASDIHVEPTEKGPMKVRFRVDGILEEKSSIPRKIQGEVINKFKTMAEIDIANKNISQDGRASFAVGSKRVDLRLVTMPTIYGENVVIRILDSDAINLDIADLGYTERSQKEIVEAVQRPHGAVLITGPTGSGKTTTLYSALSILDHDKLNIFTVEDPVEYRLPGINQCQVNVKKKMTFVHALRGFMRADPDVIMVGEIRDGETAKICIESALTGHLVLSTLHTNDAASAIARLIQMEVEPYALASTLECIVAQRLARKLCKFCKEEYHPTPDEMKFNKYPDEMINNADDYTFFKASSMGCQHCNHGGYKGRLAVSEVLVLTDSIKEMIILGKSDLEIKQQAMKEGMLSLVQDGFLKVGAGLTTVEEMKRVTM